ncbi:Bcr/CflA family efflux MFS transporter [Georgenia deserti]|uniref:Bcr/CflA family efflux MFS transporter n=1 Tax=Georgenia deserti TaxID=2093781 RepID=A0ABW4L2M8_9MICO
MSEDYRRTPGALVVLLGALTAIGPLTINLYLPAFPAIADELGASHGEVQLTMTATLVGIAVGQLVLGSVSDATGRRRPLLLAYGAYTLVSLGIAAAGSIWVLLGLRVLHGFLGAAGMVIALAVARDTSAGLAVGRTISRIMLVVGIAPLVAPALGSQLLLIGSWRLLFVALAALAAVLFVLVLLALPETLPPERRRRGGAATAAATYGGLLREPVFRGLVLVAGLTMAGQFTYITASTFVFQDTYGLSAQQYGVLFGAGAVMVTTGTQIAGFLMGRVEPVRLAGGALAVALAGATTMGVLALTIGTGPDRLWPMVAVLLPTVGAIGVMIPTIPGIALARQTHDAGSSAALIGASQFGLAAAGAPLSGLLGGSVVAMAGVMAAAYLSASLVLAVAVRR